MKKEIEIIKGQIEGVKHVSPRFSAGILLAENGDEIKFAGKLWAEVGEPVKLKGQWADKPGFGRQFEVSSKVLDLEIDAKGLAKYLANSPDFKNIGPKKAELIANTFSENFEDVLMNTPNIIAEKTSIPLECIEGLRVAWEKNRKINALAVKMANWDLTHQQIKKFVAKFGDSAVTILESDPYLLIDQIKGFGFKRLDKIARKVGIPKDHPSRIKAGIMFIVSSMMADGHCWIEFQDLLEKTIGLLVMDDLDSDVLVSEQIDVLVAEGKLVNIPYPDGSSTTMVGLTSLYDKEVDLADIFSQANRPSPHLPELGDPAALIDQIAPGLFPEQRDAAITALSYSISLMSGPGGAGKSYVITKITEALESLNKTVLLTAPTGKAAKRLEELGGRNAQTIHRLLGYNGRHYLHNRNYPIHCDVIIVDEISICATELLWRLFSSIDFSKTSVVLVGDHNQLPPIGAGNPLRDLIQTKAIPMVILTRCVRQAGILKDNSAAILSGEVRKTADTADEYGRRPWNIIANRSEPIQVQRCIVRLFETALQDLLGLDLVRDVQVLAPMKNSLIGTRALNLILQKAIQKKLYHVDIPPVSADQRPRIYLHDKVIQTRNNYKLDVMNGAVGQVVDLDFRFIVVNFDGQIVEINRKTRAVFDLELAYAITIHKFQGSEVPCAILVVHRSQSHMHHRNLFYTGVTRAKNMAVIVGDSWGIGNCAKKTQLDNRRTFLQLMLKHMGQ